MKKWRAFMDKYYPEGDKNSSFNTYGYGVAQTLEAVLRTNGDNLTRENVMKQILNLMERCDRFIAAGHRDEHLANRLPPDQAASDDAV